MALSDMATLISSPKDGMEIVTIPFGFEELPDSERNAIVPICVPIKDDDGLTIAWGWYEVIEDIQNPLRNLSRNLLGDVWRVSEVTESALKIVWRSHGTDFGRSASSRMYVQARWCARGLASGNERTRRGLDIALEELDDVLQTRLLVDPHDYCQGYDRNLDLAMLDKQLRMNGMDDVQQMLQLVRDGCTWKEIGAKLRQNPPNVQKKFRRWIHRASVTLLKNG